MNKLSLIFTALRVYKDARSQETSTLRGAITGTLAAGAIVGLWYMGADLSAEQIGLVITAIMGLDSILKIVLPDQLGTARLEAQRADTLSPSLPPLELVGRSEPALVDQTSAGAGDAGPDPGAVRHADRLRQPVPADHRSQRVEPIDPNTYPRFGAGFGDRD